MLLNLYIFFFFFNDTATTEIYTLSLHDALPIQKLSRNHQENPRLVLEHRYLPVPPNRITFPVIVRRDHEALPVPRPDLPAGVLARAYRPLRGENERSMREISWTLISVSRPAPWDTASAIVGYCSRDSSIISPP